MKVHPAARWSLWLLFALGFPLASLMLYGGLAWGVWMHAGLLNTVIWLVEVTIPLWVVLAIVGCRAYPNRSIMIAVSAWISVAALFSWNLLYGYLEDRRNEAVLERLDP